jgi:hypothetical protein
MTLYPLTNDAINNYHPGMEKEKMKIQVLDVHTGQSLFECPLTESEKAYAFAAQMEEMGLDVEVKNPTLSQTLTASLGLSQTEVAEYEKSMEEEMEHHEGSCCFEENPSPDKLH